MSCVCSGEIAALVGGDTPTSVQPWSVPGTTQMPHMLENIGAAAVTFKSNGMDELNQAIRAIETRGARLPEAVLVFSGVEAAPKN